MGGMLDRACTGTGDACRLAWNLCCRAGCSFSNPNCWLIRVQCAVDLMHCSRKPVCYPGVAPCRDTYYRHCVRLLANWACILLLTHGFARPYCRWRS